MLFKDILTCLLQFLGYFNHNWNTDVNIASHLYIKSVSRYSVQLDTSSLRTSKALLHLKEDSGSWITYGIYVAIYSTFFCLYCLVNMSAIGISFTTWLKNRVKMKHQLAKNNTTKI